jgi:dihydrofolate reductase
MKKSVFIATSLDGFIARQNGDLDWLMAVESPEPNEDYGFAEFLSSVTCLVMGRRTFEKVISFPEWAYRDTRVVVMSRSLTKLPKGTKDSVELFSGTPRMLAEKLEQAGETHLYIDGGLLIQSFIRAKLIDEIILTRIPILIGEGLPLFGPLNADILLDHINTRTFANGLVQSTYRVI